MNAKQIKPNQWYQTKKGVGKCQHVGHGGTLKFEIDGKTVYLLSKEVQHEIAPGEEPQGDPPVSILEVLETVKLHVDELEDAWESGAIVECDGLGGTRSNRNADVQRMLEKVIAHEKGTP